MNLFNVGNRQTAPDTASSPLRTASQKVSKLFSSNVSSTFGKTLTDAQAAQTAKGAPAAGSGSRQNLVTTLSNSRAALPRTTPSTTASPAAGDPPESAATGLFEQIVAEEQATAAAGKAGAPASQPADAPVAPAAPPTPYVYTQSASTDPGVFTSMNYSEELNYSTAEMQANDENGRRYQNYMTSFQNWQSNGSQGDPPQAPIYETVDRGGFNQWWAEYQQNMSSGGAPPDVSMFLINAPDYGNGYYGAAGTSQVGTLYNPTGPATPAQVQAANNAAANNSAAANKVSGAV